MEEKKIREKELPFGGSSKQEEPEGVFERVKPRARNREIEKKKRRAPLERSLCFLHVKAEDKVVVDKVSFNIIQFEIKLRSSI